MSPVYAYNVLAGVPVHGPAPTGHAGSSASGASSPHSATSAAAAFATVAGAAAAASAAGAGPQPPSQYNSSGNGNDQLDDDDEPHQDDAATEHGSIVDGRGEPDEGDLKDVEKMLEMPFCVSRECMRLETYSKLLSEGVHEITLPSTKRAFPITPDMVLEACLNTTKALELEGRDTSSRKKTLSHIHALCSTKQWAMVLDETRKLRADIVPFFIQRLLYLCDLAEAAAVAIRGRDVVWVNGNSGCGKRCVDGWSVTHDPFSSLINHHLFLSSPFHPPPLAPSLPNSTFLHRLLGSELETLAYDKVRLIRANPKHKELQDVRIGMKMASETLYVKALRMIPADYGAVLESHGVAHGCNTNPNSSLSLLSRSASADGGPVHPRHARLWGQPLARD